VANVLQTVVGPSLVYLLVTLETVVGGKGGATGFTLEFLESAVKFDVVLQRQDRLHLLPAKMADKITFAGVNRVTMRQLLGPCHKMFFAILATVRQPAKTSK
jgi:hypothetical protein